MKLARVECQGGDRRVALVEGDTVQLLDLQQADRCFELSDILHALDPLALAKRLTDSNAASMDRTAVRFLAPIDHQEVWAAGVTYKRSQVARMDESESGASHYDKVYSADRPELFFKATPNRVAGPGDPVRVRTDSRWTVPEPELTLVITPKLKLAGFTIGNDMSARDIEGENPLYLPQAKVYSQCCALGPCILLPEEPLDLAATAIVLVIEREGVEAFRGETSLDRMARSFEDLINWLGRENTFPNGVFLLTGTGIVPPDDFTLREGDSVSIEIAGIGTLTNPVAQTPVKET